MIRFRLFLVIGGYLVFACGAVDVVAQPAEPEVGNSSPDPQHDHPHYQSHPHPTTLAPERFVTNRQSEVQLALPQEKEMFTFVVFGDRTGGPPEGIEVLKQAVEDTNLLEPDLVMTVGDLVQGYNNTREWLPQMRQYKSVMDELLCPWFPVAGNHDIYWRGPNRPDRHHEKNYEQHFGPLWYALEHKNCWFIALFSDEGNPQTGEKSFEVPELQRMSDEQFSWLKQVLAEAEDADHVFLFLHHPRWLGGRYGDDWQKVHQALVDAGNVRAVFAGHIHRMRYDGPHDNIEYVTLATVGGGNSEISAEAGFLHHFNVVTVRKQQIALASIPVGEVMDVREVTGTVSEEVQQIAGTPPRFPVRPQVTIEGQTTEPTMVELFNPSSQPVEYEGLLDPADRNWIAKPDHFHRKLHAGQRESIPLEIRATSAEAVQNYRPPRLLVRADYLAEGARFGIRERSFHVPVAFDIPEPPRPPSDLALETGPGNYVAVEDYAIELPQGPMTLECWCKANSFDQRVGLIAKTESSEYGIFVSGGIPYFTLHLDGRYIEPKDMDLQLDVSRWYHLAGVYDGRQVRLYVDGQLVAEQSASGKRRTNRLPLLVGADVNGAGEATSPFDGMIDAVRLSSVARYEGETFTPERRLETDEETHLLLNFDDFVGPFAYDESSGKAHARRHGEAELVPAE